MKLWLPLSLMLLLIICPPADATSLRVQVASEADVYAQPNFESKKIEHLEKGTVVTMRTDKFIGGGGMGVFFKIKTPSGKVGFITDSDLLSQSAEGLKPIPVPASQAAPAPPPKPVAPKPLWGLSLALVNYSEEIKGKTFSKPHLFFGARRTGAPMKLWNMRTDAGILVAPGAPKFLSSAGAYGKTTGFITLIDCLALVPFAGGKSYNFFAGAGPLLAYSNYSTNLDTGPFSVAEFRVGIDADLGFALNFSGNSLRFDLKYYVEKTMYLSEMVTLQMSF